AAAESQARRPVNSEWLTDAHVPAGGGPAPGGGGALQNADLPPWLRNQPPGPSRADGPRRGGPPAQPLRTAEVPAWPRGGPGGGQGAGGAAGASGRRRPSRAGDGRPGDSAQWAGSRVRAPREDPRRYGDDDDADEDDAYGGYDERGYEDWDEAPPDE